MTTRRIWLCILGVFLALMASLWTLKSAAYQKASISSPDHPASPPNFAAYITVWQDNVDNYDPAVAYNKPHDEYLVSWFTMVDTYTWNIWAQRVRGDGNLETGFNVATGPAEKRWQPDVAYNPIQEQYLIVYRREISSGDDDINGKLVNWNGADVHLAPTIYIDIAMDIQKSPKVAYNSSSNEFLVVFVNVAAGGAQEIEGRVIDSSGTLLTNTMIATGTMEMRLSPDVAYNPIRNEYLVVYEYMSITGSTDSDIYARLVSGDLSQISPEIHVVDNDHDQIYPTVAAGPDEYLVSWSDADTTSWIYDIFSRRVSADGGIPQGPADGFLVTEYFPNTCFNSDSSYNPVYGYMLTWYYVDDGYENDAYGNHVHAGQDHPNGLSYYIAGGYGSMQENPAIACTPDGDCLAAVEDNVNYPSWTPEDFEIRGSLIFPYPAYLPLIRR